MIKLNPGLQIMLQGAGFPCNSGITWRPKARNIVFEQVRME